LIQLDASLCGMVRTMIGTKTLKRGGVSLSQDTKKLNMGLLKESSRDYRKDVANEKEFAADLRGPIASRGRTWPLGAGCLEFASVLSFDAVAMTRCVHRAGRVTLPLRGLDPYMLR
jgi:hypothetical protein